jgi:5'-nucleotidase
MAWMSDRARFRVAAAGLLVVALALAGCTSDGDGAPTPTAPATTVAPEPIQVLVTNDDGVGAEGIDAVVEGLRQLEDVEVTVVAPATNQSGTGDQTTDGPLIVTDVTTRSGYPAKAVAGFPADSIVWAVDLGGIGVRPDVVISGLNAGQSMGPVVDASGTVGAARAAAARGVPSLAASQGLGNPPAFATGQTYVVEWFEAHRDAIAEGSLPTTTVANLNVPTCIAGAPRGEVETTPAPTADGFTEPPDCTSTAPAPSLDIAAFLVGFVSLSELPARP